MTWQPEIQEQPLQAPVSLDIVIYNIIMYVYLLMCPTNHLLLQKKVRQLLDFKIPYRLYYEYQSNGTPELPGSGTPRPEPIQNS